MNRRVVILGAGGHARVLLSALRADKLTVSGCIAREVPEEPWPSSIEYLGPDSVLQQLDPRKTALVNGIASTHSTKLRQRMFELGKALGFNFLTVLNSRSFIADDAILNEGVQVMMGAVVQCGVVLGANSIINTGVIVDHDCRIGAHAHLAPGACLSGTVTIGDGAHIGTGATVIQGIAIGDAALIAAGSVVVAHVPAGVAVAGVPAKPMGPFIA